MQPPKLGINRLRKNEKGVGHGFSEKEKKESGGIWSLFDCWEGEEENKNSWLSWVGTLFVKRQERRGVKEKKRGEKSSLTGRIGALSEFSFF